MVKKYTMAEVKEHSSPTDVWTVIHDKVYDVTKFLNEHPGGDEVLIEAGGKNSTRVFDDVDHSAAAIEQMANYYIGDIVDEERREKTAQSSTNNEASGSTSAAETSQSKICIGAISAVAVAVGALVLFKGYKMFKSSN